MKSAIQRRVLSRVIADKLHFQFLERFEVSLLYIIHNPPHRFLLSVLSYLGLHKSSIFFVLNGGLISSLFIFLQEFRDELFPARFFQKISVLLHWAMRLWRITHVLAITTTLFNLHESMFAPPPIFEIVPSKPPTNVRSPFGQLPGLK